MPTERARCARVRVTSAVCSIGFAVVACGSDPPPPPPADAAPPPVTAIPLTAAQHLTRASLVLRGVRPTLEDLQAVTADRGALPAIVDRYLASPEFGETIRELHNETLLMRLEQPTYLYPALAPLAAITAREMEDGIFDEPLRLIEDIVVNDRPYTEIVTADYTMANPVTAAIWGLPHSPTDQWERATWPDDRPALGILATNAFNHRWRSTGFNFNRGRANQISRALLCHDFLESDIAVDGSVDLSDPDVVANAVIANPSCAGCHQTLDPLASYLFTFRGTLPPVAVTSYPVSYYTPRLADRWKTANKRPPRFFGSDTGDLAGLGTAIASDPRFAPCTAKRFASFFTETPVDQLSHGWVARLAADLVASKWSAKALARAIVLSDEFAVAGDRDGALAETTVGVLKLRPEQLHRMVRGLTGLEWSTTSTLRIRQMPYGTANLLDSDFVGFRVLGGGIDSYFVTDPVHTMTPTSLLVARSAAAAAAEFVVEHDRTAPRAQRTLFVECTVDESDDTKLRAQLAYLQGRVFGELVAADGPEVGETLALYHDAFAASGDRARAWKVTLIGMLTDFRALFY